MSRRNKNTTRLPLGQWLNSAKSKPKPEHESAEGDGAGRFIRDTSTFAPRPFEQYRQSIPYPKPQFFSHPLYLHNYRQSTIGLCEIEIDALRHRAKQNIMFGSPEMLETRRTCPDKKCGAQHHWCVTCRAAPRCSCLLPHSEPTSHHDGRRTFDYRQDRFITRLGSQLCDDRYGTLVNLLLETSAGADSGYDFQFCDDCVEHIMPMAKPLHLICGRTYKEMLNRMYDFVPWGLFCPMCIMMITRLPCMSLGANCPSMDQPLLLTAVVEYKGENVPEAVINSSAAASAAIVTYPPTTEPRNLRTFFDCIDISNPTTPIIYTETPDGTLVEYTSYEPFANAPNLYQDGRPWENIATEWPAHLKGPFEN